MNNKAVIILVGPSCSGKSFLSQRLMSTGLIGESVSTTTRAPRSGEVDGVHYHFINDEEFQVKKSNGEFIETIEFSGKKYGVTADEFKKLFEKGMTPLVVAEPNGAEQVSNFSLKEGWTPVCIFINVPIKVAIQRFSERMLKDFEEKKSDAVFEYYAGRIADALAIETKWKNMLRYDHVVPVSDTIEKADLITEEIIKQVKKIKDGDTPDWKVSKEERSIIASTECSNKKREAIKTHVLSCILGHKNASFIELSDLILKGALRLQKENHEELSC